MWGYVLCDFMYEYAPLFLASGDILAIDYICSI